MLEGSGVHEGEPGLSHGPRWRDSSRWQGKAPRQWNWGKGCGLVWGHTALSGDRGPRRERVRRGANILDQAPKVLR